MKINRKPMNPGNALLRVASLCAASEQSEGDLRRKLVGWGIDDHDIDDIIFRLKRDNYLNEERFAHAYCRDKFKFNRWGRIKIAFMMKSKGISHEVIEQALQEIDEEEYMAVLEQLLKSKWHEVNTREPVQARAALMRFAVGRGFEPEVVYPAAERVMKRQEEE